MAMIRRSKGHFYNGQENASCPLQDEGKSGCGDK
jgi:hypothetical protein